MTDIRKAVVIGAGVMGAGIAAHLANAGTEVVLLDIDAERARAGIARQLAAGGFMQADFAARVRPGATDDDIGLIADADWIVEAVAERLDIKQGLYRAIEARRRPGSIVSSNTSTIPLAALVAGLPETFARDFLITHFFNPPRRMRLLELVSGPMTRADAVATLAQFGAVSLGKQVVRCNDTPGFIANRIGNYWMVLAQNEAIARGLAPEDADAVLGRPFGIPPTGIFGLLDLVGIDLMPMVLRSLQAALPAADPINACEAEPALIAQMIAAGRTGRKAGAGFTRLSADRRSRETLDLTTGAYRPARPAAALPASDPRALMDSDTPLGAYAAAVMVRTLGYAAALVPEIADTPDAVDAAMRTGYGWREGPFEMIDRLGAGWLAEHLAGYLDTVPPYLRLAATAGGFYGTEAGRRTVLLPDGQRRALVPPEGEITLAALSLARPPVARWEAGALWDLGEGVAGFEIRSKANAIGETVLDAIEAALDRVGGDFSALVIGSDAAAFSVGADLRAVLAMADDPAQVRAFIARGQNVLMRLRQAPVPVVAAAAGPALGGGCEICLHSDAVQAHAELSMGLVEAKVGLVPAWGGSTTVLHRTGDAAQALRLLIGAQASGSAFGARPVLLRPTDAITMNRDRLLADARARALALVPGYRPPAAPAPLPATERGALQTVLDGLELAPHDRRIGAALIDILAPGGSEEELRAREREAFVGLIAMPATRERMQHMLATGKPLRN